MKHCQALHPLAEHPQEYRYAGRILKQFWFSVWFSFWFRVVFRSVCFFDSFWFSVDQAFGFRQISLKSCCSDASVPLRADWTACSRRRRVQWVVLLGVFFSYNFAGIQNYLVSMIGSVEILSSFPEETTWFWCTPSHCIIFFLCLVSSESTHLKLRHAWHAAERATVEAAWRVLQPFGWTARQNIQA